MDHFITLSTVPSQLPIDYCMLLKQIMKLKTLGKKNIIITEEGEIA